MIDTLSQCRLLQLQSLSAFEVAVHTSGPAWDTPSGNCSLFFPHSETLSEFSARQSLAKPSGPLWMRGNRGGAITPRLHQDCRPVKHDLDLGYIRKAARATPPLPRWPAVGAGNCRRWLVYGVLALPAVTMGQRRRDRFNAPQSPRADHIPNPSELRTSVKINSAREEIQLWNYRETV
jgi:hypothetical protein